MEHAATESAFDMIASDLFAARIRNAPTAEPEVELVVFASGARGLLRRHCLGTGRHCDRCRENDHEHVFHRVLHDSGVAHPESRGRADVLAVRLLLDRKRPPISGRSRRMRRGISDAGVKARPKARRGGVPTPTEGPRYQTSVLESGHPSARGSLHLLVAA